MALAGSTVLLKQTALQQLLEEINFQRAKELRQMLKDGNSTLIDFYHFAQNMYLC